MDQESSAISLNAALLEENAELRLEVAHLKERCRELEGKIGKNSQNSSKPPPSYGYQKPNKNSDSQQGSSSSENPESSPEKPNPKSLRQTSGNKAGGKKGHQGACLKRVDIPDFIKYHTVKQCHCCQLSLLGVKPKKIIERQVFEPGKPGEYEVTAHMGEVKICPCGCRNEANFPEGVTEALLDTPVAGADETGMRAEGSLHWLHIMRDEQWTLYYPV